MPGEGAAVTELIRTALAAADRLDPVERDALYTALVADLRTCRPEAVSPVRDPERGSVTPAIVDALRTLLGADDLRGEFQTALHDTTGGVL